jgi:hypothetical protein
MLLYVVTIVLSTIAIGRQALTRGLCMYTSPNLGLSFGLATLYL